jgi:Uma2 family endonuclease
MRIAQSYSLYDWLTALPESLTGEILNGQLHTQPRPSGSHMGVESALQIELGGPFDRGRGGPGGWRILVEPEIHFVRDQAVCVPDLAGWRRLRLPELPQDQRFEVVPDWVCEILSPSTESKDRQIKMPIYARYGVGFAWLIDPLKQTLEAFVLEGSGWRLLGHWRGKAIAAAPPFDACGPDQVSASHGRIG